MNRVIYALGCANGAAMAALNPADLDRMTDAQMVAAILPYVGKVPMATNGQLAGWLAGDEYEHDGEGLHGLDGFKKWRKKLRRLVTPWSRGGHRATAVTPAATITATPANFATLHGLDGLDGWKKRLKRLRKNLKKVAAFAVAPAMGGTKGIQAQFKFVKKNPMILTAAGLFTGNPLLMKAGQELKKRKAAADYAAMARRAGLPEQPEPEPQPAPEPQSATYQQPAYAAGPSRSYSDTSQDTGTVTRLNPEGQEAPQVVGFNWGGIADSIKANPVPWAAGAGLGLYLITRSK